MADNKTILILGVGNILLRDEGLGVRAVEYIKDRFYLPEDVLAVDGGTCGLTLLSLIKDFDHVIFIDAVRGDATPGTLYRIPGDELHRAPPLMTTAHSIGVYELLAISSLEGYNLEVVIIGMEPLDISPGLELSPLVKERLPRIAELVGGELKRYGLEMRKRDA